MLTLFQYFVLHFNSKRPSTSKKDYDEIGICVPSGILAGKTSSRPLIGEEEITAEPLC
jgi:hypothetical protein